MMLLPKKFGPVTLMRKLSSDGVAETFAGILDEPAGKMVVVRRLMPYVTRDAALLGTVEARIEDLSNLRHPVLVPTLEYQTIDDERLIIEEHVDSVGLDEVLAWCGAEGTSVPHNVYLDMATQICNGLEALHGRPGAASGAEHVLHLALRPSVVRLTREGKLLVGDYGLIRSPTSLPHGGAGPVPTLMEYLSPEQTHPDRELTPASDIFALGSILYEFLTLEPLFRAQSNLQTIHRVRKAEVTPHLLRVKEILPGLDKVLYRALSLNPRHRYQRAFVLREDLRGLMAGYTFSNIAEDTVAFLAPIFARVAEEAPEDYDPLDESTASLLARAVADPGPAEPGPVRLEPAASMPEFDPPPRPDTLVPDNLDGLDEDAMFPEAEPEETTLPGEAMPTFYDEGEVEDEGVPTAIDDEGAPTTIDESHAPPTPAGGPIPEEHTSWHRRETPAPEDSAADDPQVSVADGEETEPGEPIDDGPVVAAHEPAPTLTPENESARPASEPSWDDEDRPTDVKVDPTSEAPPEPQDAEPEPPPVEPPPAEPPSDDDWDDLDYKPSGGMGKWALIGGGAVLLLVVIGVCAGVGAGGVGLGWLSMDEDADDAPEVVSSLTVEEPDAPDAVPAEPGEPAEPAEAPEPAAPTASPSETPTASPSATPTAPPSGSPTATPSASPTSTPGSTASSWSPTTRPVPEPDDIAPSIDLAPEPKGTLDVADLEPPLPPADDVDIVLSFDEVRSELAQFTDRAYRGALTAADKSVLEGVTEADPDYTKAMVILYQDAKARGDSSGRRDYVSRAMALPENQYNPQLLCEVAALAIDHKEYGQALDAANLAERHWARLPSEHIFVRKAMIYEVQAAAHQGLFYQSEGDDLDQLHAAIRSWEKYQRHVNTKSRRDLSDKADDQLAKLHDIQRRLE